MAISFVGSMAAVSAANGGDVTLTFTGASGLLDTAGGTTTLLQNDVVVVAYTTSIQSDQAMSTSSTGWTKLDELYANASSGTPHDTNFSVFYKVMGATPDTSMTVVGPGGTAPGTIATAFAFRGCDPTTPVDVFVAGTNSTTGLGTGQPNPPAITPSASGAWIVVAAGAAAATGAAFTNPGDLSTTTNHFRSGNVVETHDAMVGIGIKTNWASGAFDPGQWGGGSATADDSWAAVTFSLDPAGAGGAATSLAPLQHGGNFLSHLTR